MTSDQENKIEVAYKCVRNFTGFILPMLAAIAVFYFGMSPHWLSSVLLIDSVVWRITGHYKPTIKKMKKARRKHCPSYDVLGI